MSSSKVLSLLIIVPLLLAVSTVKAQNNEFGIFLGGSYYNGDLNPRRHFADVTSPAFGIFHDAHINSRYTWRTMFTYGKLMANDRLSSIGLNNFRDLQFKTDVYDLSGQIVFNFLPYGNSINVKPYTPYIFIGLAVYNVKPQVSSMSGDTSLTAFPKEDYTRKYTSVAIPFGLGFKVITGSITFGIEWSFRKTFSDKIDGIDNQFEIGNKTTEPVQYSQPDGFQKGTFYTDDWYSFAGVTISYRPQPKKNACPGLD